jgi:hypothetical protein
MYRAGSLRVMGEEILKYKLGLSGIQEDKWDRSGIEPADKYIFIYGKGNQDNDLGIVFFVHKKQKLGRDWR